MYIPFRFGRNEWKISYQYANWYETAPYFTSGKISGCFGMFQPFRPVSAGMRNPAEILFWLFIYLFFLSFHLTGPKSLLNFDLSFFSAPSSSFFFPPSSFSVTFLYIFSFGFFPKRRRRNGFWFKCHAPLPSPFFFSLLSSSSSSFFFPPRSLSLYAFSLLFFFFFFCLFGSSASLHVILLDICLKFLLHLHFGVLCTLFFYFFYLSDISSGFTFIFLLYYSNTSA